VSDPRKVYLNEHPPGCSVDLIMQQYTREKQHVYPTVSKTAARDDTKYQFHGGYID